MKKLAILILAGVLWASPVAAVSVPKGFNTQNVPLTIGESVLMTTDDLKELRCLALNIYHEARGSTEEDRFGVALVTVNRVASERYKTTVCEVVWQRWRKQPQFSWTTKHNLTRNKIDIKAWENAQRIAYIVLVDKTYHDITYNSICFHKYAVKKLPKWMGKDYILIGSHVYTSKC